MSYDENSKDWEQNKDPRESRRNYQQVYPPQQPYQQPPNQQGYPPRVPPPRKSGSKKKVIIISAIVAAIVVGAAFAFLVLHPFGAGSESTKTLWDVVKEYDTNHDGKISESEINNAHFTDYKPGDTIHIKDVINRSIGMHVATLTQNDVDSFYNTFRNINPSINIRAGDTYTFFAVQSVLNHVGNLDNPVAILAVVGLPGNLTGKYHSGDTIAFTTTVHSAEVNTINIELTEANMMGLLAPTSGGSPDNLIATLIYNSQQSSTTKAVLEVSISNPSSAVFSSVAITLSGNGDTESTTLNPDGTATIYLNGAEYDIRVLDLDGNGMLSDGDMIVIDGNGNSVGGLTVALSIDGYSGNVQIFIPS